MTLQMRIATVLQISVAYYICCRLLQAWRYTTCTFISRSPFLKYLPSRVSEQTKAKNTPPPSQGHTASTGSSCVSLVLTCTRKWQRPPLAGDASAPKCRQPPQTTLQHPLFSHEQKHRLRQPPQQDGGRRKVPVRGRRWQGEASGRKRAWANGVSTVPEAT